MTNDEAADVLLGPPERVLLERSLERIKNTILQSYDAGYMLEMETSRTVGYDSVKIVRLEYTLTVFDPSHPNDGAEHSARSTKILSKNR